MKHKLLIITIYTLFPALVFSQADPKFSQNMFNQMSINPGYAGSSEVINLTAINRQQWMGLEGAPMTSIFNANAPFSLFGGNHGTGISVFNDKFGFNNDISFNISYAYRIKAGPGKLGIGISGGMRSNKLSPEWSNAISEIDFNPTGDPSIPQSETNFVSYDLGFGLFYNTENMYMGFSATHLNQPKINNLDKPSFLKRHFYLTSGYNLQIASSLFELIPSVYIEFDGSETNININTNLLYNKKFWGGVSYNADNTISIMAGLEIFGGVRAGYAYDIVTSQLGGYSSGTHEFMMGYSFSVKKEKTPQKYKSIRFL